MASKKPTTQKPTSTSMGKITVVLTKDNVDLLKALSQEASDRSGRTISGSAILRALVRYAAKQGRTWQRETIFPVLEEEITSSTVRGTKTR